MPIICEGCGQRVPIPEGYRRNKIQCACGVICAVPESERSTAEEPAVKRKAPARDVEADAERWLLDDSPPPARPDSEPPAFRDPEPVEESAPAVKRTVKEMRFPCRKCGRMVRRQGECPDCNADQMPAAGKEPVFWPSVDEPEDKKAADDDEEDSSPYVVEGGEEVRCPKCSFMLPPGSVLCVRCGFHLHKRKKVTKTYQPIERVWETNGSYSTRLTIFWTCTGVTLVTGLTGIVWRGADWSVFLPAFVIVTAMLAFLLGTFDRIHLTRDARGRVKLTKTWRVCFFARQPRTLDLREFDGIVTGRHREVSAWEYLVFVFLFVSGIVPGILWWYLVIYKVTFHVSLSRDHGFPAYVLYSGWNEMQMKEIAYTLRDASGLRYDEG